MATIIWMAIWLGGALTVAIIADCAYSVTHGDTLKEAIERIL